jgi:hypothetical protein
MDDLIELKVLTVDEPTKRGRLYPSDVVHEALKKAKEQEVLVCFGTDPEEMGTVPLRKVCAKVVRWEIRDHALYAFVELLDTPSAQYLEMVRQTGSIVEGSLPSFGLEDDNHVVTEMEILRVDVNPM